jgi:hypothetical protein
MTRFLTAAALIAALIGPAHAQSVHEDAVRMVAAVNAMPTICGHKAPLDMKVIVSGFAVKAGIKKKDNAAELQDKKAEFIESFRDMPEKKRATECDALVAWIKSVAGQPEGPVIWKGLKQ